MGKIETVMKEEIARLARREVRQSVVPLKKEVRGLRARVRDLESRLRAAEKTAKHRAEGCVTPPLEADAEEVEAARINGKWVQSLRSKLNLTQSDLARILGISVSGVRTWEYDLSKPRGKNREALVALRKLGRRDVKNMLAEKPPAA